eukprot:22623-Hanusia_phi.AAC.1
MDRTDPPEPSTRHFRLLDGNQRSFPQSLNTQHSPYRTWHRTGGENQQLQRVPQMMDNNAAIAITSNSGYVSQ